MEDSYPSSSSAKAEAETASVKNELVRKFSRTVLKEGIIEFLLLLCGLITILTTLGIIVVLLSETIISFTSDTPFFHEISLKEFFFDTKWTPTFADQHFGILPLLCGTMMVALIAGLIGLPVGLGIAIYLSEYATPRVRSVVKPILEILAGIPTIVYGFFALMFITPWVLQPIFSGLLGFDVPLFNAASAGIVVGIMIVPMVSSLSEDALRAVPNGLREAGYALGSTKFDVSTKVVVPSAFSGVVASFILALSRAIGETMAVTIAAGSTPVTTLNPFTSISTMTAFIVNMSSGDATVGTIEYKSLYAVALTLFIMTLLMNILSQAIMRRYREVYQ